MIRKVPPDASGHVRRQALQNLDEADAIGPFGVRDADENSEDAGINIRTAVRRPP
jgi:hypothetical protein